MSLKMPVSRFTYIMTVGSLYSTRTSCHYVRGAQDLLDGLIDITDQSHTHTQQFLPGLDESFGQSLNLFI